MDLRKDHKDNLSKIGNLKIFFFHLSSWYYPHFAPPWKESKITLSQ